MDALAKALSWADLVLMAWISLHSGQLIVFGVVMIGPQQANLMVIIISPDNQI